MQCLVFMLGARDMQCLGVHAGCAHDAEARTLSSGSAYCRNQPTTAWPASCSATVRRSTLEMTLFFFSRAADDAVNSVLEVRHGHGRLGAPSRKERCLVAHIGNVRTSKACDTKAIAAIISASLCPGRGVK